MRIFCYLFITPTELGDYIIKQFPSLTQMASQPQTPLPLIRVFFVFAILMLTCLFLPVYAFVFASLYYLSYLCYVFFCGRKKRLLEQGLLKDLRQRFQLMLYLPTFGFIPLLFLLYSTDSFFGHAVHVGLLPIIAFVFHLFSCPLIFFIYQRGYRLS